MKIVLEPKSKKKKTYFIEEKYAKIIIKAQNYFFMILEIWSIVVKSL